MRRIIVGTAGHIDHGKTTLVKALTGIDCDRWQEEKDRGITIDLGFAYLREGDLQIGFVDVPGHERFLHNALAGLGGIRVMLLVVAADEGVKPQTREHLGICSLLGIPAGVVALTKADLVAEDLLELAQLEVEELLADSPFAGATVIPVSSTTGQGIPELRQQLLTLAEHCHRDPDLELPTRLPLDRAFHLRGLGVVVTGTLASGVIRTGDQLARLPGGAMVRVRSIQIHGEGRGEALAGERTSLQLSGIELEELARGQQLSTPEAFEATNRLLAHVQVLREAPAELSGWVPVRVHLYSSQVVGMLRPVDPPVLPPGGQGLAEIRLSAPLTATREDRFVLTRPSPALTLGGGRVLDPGWRRPKGSLLREALQGLSGGLAPALRQWVMEAGEKGATAQDLARRLGVPAERLRAPLGELVREGDLLEVPEGPGHPAAFVSARAYARVAQRARRVLDSYFAKDRLARGIPRAEAVRRILPGRAAALADVYLPWLQKQQVIALQDDLVNRPGRQVELTGEESLLSRAVTERYERAGLDPPPPGDVAVELQAKPQILEGVLRFLVSRGDLVRLPNGLLIARSALDGLRRAVLDSDWERFSVADFKDRFGLSRKWAIPLLEHLDSSGLTRRLGDERMVVRGLS